MLCLGWKLSDRSGNPDRFLPEAQIFPPSDDPDAMKPRSGVGIGSFEAP